MDFTFTQEEEAFRQEVRAFTIPYFLGSPNPIVAMTLRLISDVPLRIL